MTLNSELGFLPRKEAFLLLTCQCKERVLERLTYLQSFDVGKYMPEKF